MKSSNIIAAVLVLLGIGFGLKTYIELDKLKISTNAQPADVAVNPIVKYDGKECSTEMSYLANNSKEFSVFISMHRNYKGEPKVNPWLVTVENPSGKYKVQDVDYCTAVRKASEILEAQLNATGKGR